MAKPPILLTNDDGIRAPGLWAAAAALETVGYVHVVAPRDQSTGMGRSLPGGSEGTIEIHKVRVNGREWTVYAVAGSPAQAVIHAVLEVLPVRPDIVVSGINAGENFGTGVTISGTVGAALEGAGMGFRSLAVSQEADKVHHTTYSEDIDYTAAASYTARFARALLNGELPPDVDVLKLEVPAHATPETGWRMARLSRVRYYRSNPPAPRDWSQPTKLDYTQAVELDEFPTDSDVYVTRVLKEVAVTPLSLDLTSRVSLESLGADLRERMEGGAST